MWAALCDPAAMHSRREIKNGFSAIDRECFIYFALSYPVCGRVHLLFSGVVLSTAWLYERVPGKALKDTHFLTFSTLV